jgi:hypothetical protein
MVHRTTAPDRAVTRPQHPFLYTIAAGHNVQLHSIIAASGIFCEHAALPLTQEPFVHDNC